MEAASVGAGGGASSSPLFQPSNLVRVRGVADELYRNLLLPFCVGALYTLREVWRGRLVSRTDQDFTDTERS